VTYSKPGLRRSMIKSMAEEAPEDDVMMICVE
jgi:hypothetical protein